MIIRAIAIRGRMEYIHRSPTGWRCSLLLLLLLLRAAAAAAAAADHAPLAAGRHRSRCVAVPAALVSAAACFVATDDKVRWTGRTVRSSPEMAEGHVRWSYAGVSASFVAIQSTEVYMQCGSTFTSGAAIVHVYLNGALHQEMALVNDIPPLTIATAAES